MAVWLLKNERDKSELNELHAEYFGCGFVPTKYIFAS